MNPFAPLPSDTRPKAQTGFLEGMAVGFACGLVLVLVTLPMGWAGMTIFSLPPAALVGGLMGLMAALTPRWATVLAGLFAPLLTAALAGALLGLLSPELG